MQFAEALGVEYTDVHPQVVDTESVGYTEVTGGSRVTYATGYAVYELAQASIARQLLGVYRNAPGSTVVFLAQSLGCQVLSSYIYDAQKALSGEPVLAGIWKNVDDWAMRTLGHRLTSDERRFQPARDGRSAEDQALEDPGADGGVPYLQGPPRLGMDGLAHEAVR